MLCKRGSPFLFLSNIFRIKRYGCRAAAVTKKSEAIEYQRFGFFVLGIVLYGVKSLNSTLISNYLRSGQNIWGCFLGLIFFEAILKFVTKIG